MISTTVLPEVGLSRSSAASRSPFCTTGRCGDGSRGFTEFCEPFFHWLFNAGQERQTAAERLDCFTFACLSLVSQSAMYIGSVLFPRHLWNMAIVSVKSSSSSDER